MRLFIALNLPEEERASIHEHCAGLRERDLPVRWVDPEHYHVTLKFLGEVRDDRLDEVRDGVERAAAGNGTFEAGLEGFGAFPTIRRPRVLWLGVEATPELRCVKQDLEWVLGSLGFEKEVRAFHPHVTLGRAHRGGGAGAFRGLDEVVAAIDYGSRVEFGSVDLMRSRLSAEGPSYSVVSSIPLGETG